MVRPGCEVELCHFQRPLRATSKLYLCVCVSVCVCIRVFEQITHQLYERRQFFVSAVYPDRLYTQTISPVTMGANFCLVFLPVYISFETHSS